MDNREKILAQLNAKIKAGSDIKENIQYIKENNISISGQENGAILTAFSKSLDDIRHTNTTQFLTFCKNLKHMLGIDGIITRSGFSSLLEKAFTKPSTQLEPTKKRIEETIALIKSHYSNQAPDMIRDFLFTCSKNIRDNDFILKALKENNCITTDSMVKWQILEELIFNENGAFRNDPKNIVALRQAVSHSPGESLNRFAIYPDSERKMQNYLTYIIKDQDMNSEDKLKEMEAWLELDYFQKKNVFRNSDENCNKACRKTRAFKVFIWSLSPFI